MQPHNPRRHHRAKNETIAAVLSAADQEIDTLKKKLDCLKQEKKALMQRLLIGKSQVKVETIKETV